MKRFLVLKLDMDSNLINLMQKLICTELNGEIDGTEEAILLIDGNGNANYSEISGITQLHQGAEFEANYKGLINI